MELALAAMLLTTAVSQTRDGPPPSQAPPQPRTSPPSVSTTRQPPSREGHGTDTNPGQSPHGSGNGAAIAGAAAGAAVGGILIGELIAHHNASPEHFGKNGPEVPKQLDMSSFAVKGLVGPNWPVVLDFMLDSPGSAQIEITAADKHHMQATLTNPPNRRAYGIFRIPPNFGTKVQTAVFQVRSVAAAATTTPAAAGAGTRAAAPGLRVYGMGAGERAVGSVAIDQLTFQPAIIHPKAKEVATFGFHAHSAFNGVRAEFIFTTLYNGHILVELDQEQKLSPIPEGERAQGTWEGKGKTGQHMLQVRAWRGLENGGDWVVAWSPDIVDVVK